MADVLSPPGQVPEPWKEGEEDLRREEVRHSGTTARTGFYSTVAQGVIACAALFATFLAYGAAKDASRAVDVAAEGIERQSSEDRLGTAVSATGGDQPAERSAGFRLLQHLATREIENALSEGGSERDRQDAHSLYGASLDVLEVYLRNGPDVPVDTETEGLGYGYPTVPIDNMYAAGVLRKMMGLKQDVLGLGGTAPDLDLAHVQLFGVHWPEIDFSWPGGRFFPGIDLREANLRDSRWGEITKDGPRGSTLTDAFLQCADLTRARLMGANLEGADLRGATLIDAKLMGAKLAEADLRGADLTGVEDLTAEQLEGAIWDEKTVGLGAYGPPPGPLATAPPNTDGTCIGDYQALPPANDVVLGECLNDDVFGPKATGTLTNPTSKLSNYIISVNFTDEAGVIVATGTASADKIPPGSTAPWEAVGTDVTSASCSVVKVDRMSSVR
jgi:hypothetical protein